MTQTQVRLRRQKLFLSFRISCVSSVCLLSPELQLPRAAFVKQPGRGALLCSEGETLFYLRPVPADTGD